MKYLILLTLTALILSVGCSKSQENGPPASTVNPPTSTLENPSLDALNLVLLPMMNGEQAIEDLVEARALVEGELAALACQRATEEERGKFDEWRNAHPANYTPDPYSRWATFNAPKIDWKKFKKAKPQEYQKIEKEVKRLGVTWEQAVNDWETRVKIWKAIGYYY